MNTRNLILDRPGSCVRDLDNGTLIPIIDIPRPFVNHRYLAGLHPEVILESGEPRWLRLTLHSDHEFGGPSVRIDVTLSILESMERSRELAIVDWMGDIGIYGPEVIVPLVEEVRRVLASSPPVGIERSS